MMIFPNKNRSYPIRGIDTNIPGVSYHTGPKGWMDWQTLIKWLSKPRVISKDIKNHHRIIYMDNCGGHNETPELNTALEELHASIQKLPPNSTHLCQPCDAWPIQKIKQEWTTLWEAEKLKQITAN